VPPIWATPNLLSLSRILAAPILYLLVVRPGRYGFFAALIVFALASFTDTLDGRIARRRGLVSPLGVFLDTTADKILVAVLLVALVVVGLSPGWMAALIIAREFLVTGLRSYAAALGVVIPAGGWGKAKTLITIAALLLVILAGDVSRGGLLSGNSLLKSLLLTSVGPFTLPVWSLLITVIWTVASGAEYVREAAPLLAGRASSSPPYTSLKGDGDP
jgi:CDP-diacylglycerol--glycerol-3-phosphate 3-phosphatidyltransferase